MREFGRHVNKLDLAGFVFLLLVFLLAFYVRISGGGDTAPVMWISGIAGLLLGWLVLMPVRYRFAEETLSVEGPWPLKGRTVRYTDILELDSVGSFAAYRMDADSAELILTCRKADSDRTFRLSCHPTGAKEFAELIKERCPNLLSHEGAAAGGSLLSVLRGKRSRDTKKSQEGSK